MERLNYCVKQRELQAFEVNILRKYYESFKKEEKQKKLSEFIKQYANEIRIYFCENICKLYDGCKVYEDFKKSSNDSYNENKTL